MRARMTAALCAGAIAVASFAAHAAAAGGRTYSAGLVTVCATDTFVRIAGVNDSPLAVTITPIETGSNGQAVQLLNNNASDELTAIFPVIIPAGSNGAVTWDLPLPAHLGGEVRKGNNRNLHGSWLPKQWHDENGLDYKGTTGSAAPNGTACGGAAPASTTTTTTPPPSSQPPTSEPPDGTTTTTSSVPPAGDPVKVRPLAVYSTSNSQNGALAVDGDPATEFVTQMAEGAPPTWAWLSFDLGEQVPLQRIEWLFTVDGAADQFRVEISTDGRAWATLAEPTASQAGVWADVDPGATARLIRFYWRNPAHDPQLGHLGEVNVWAQPGFTQGQVPVSPTVGEMHSRGEATVELPSIPKTTGTRYVIQGSKRSSNSPDQSSRLPLDGKQTTSWATSMSVAPRTGWTLYDLGSVVPLGEVKWTFSQVGYADAYKVQVSSDGQRWTTLATRGNAAAPAAWQTLDANVAARFVRFFFNNPNGDANIGYLAEVRCYAPA